MSTTAINLDPERARANAEQAIERARHRAWAAVLACLVAAVVASFAGRSILSTQDGRIADLEARLEVAEVIGRTTFIHAQTEKCGSAWIGYARRDASMLCLIQDDPSSIALRWGPCTTDNDDTQEPTP